jgi:uncharacterized membrane protein
MLREYIATTSAGEKILEWIELAALAIEIIAVVIIIGAIVYALTHYFSQSVLRRDNQTLYQQLKIRMGKALLLGLEILVAADIIRTVALEATFQSVVVLGLLIMIRTFLSWALVVEIEGRWPWQAKHDPEDTM